MVGMIKQNKHKIRIEHKLIKSLDSRLLSELRTIHKVANKMEEVSRKGKLSQKYHTQKKVEHKEIIEETYQKIIKLDRDMVLIDKIKNKNLKEIHLILYIERVTVPKKLLSNAQKKDYNMNFSKLNPYLSVTSKLASSNKDILL